MIETEPVHEAERTVVVPQFEICREYAEGVG